MGDKAKAVEVADRVFLSVPGSPADGREGKVEHLIEWGAHLSTGFGSGAYRAAWHEMVACEAPPVRAVSVAKASGYTGDACSNCQGSKVRRNGACLLCDDCGTTSGCS